MHTEARIKRFDILHGSQTGVLTHGDCESIEKAHLTQQDSERRFPVRQESNLCFPFDEIIIVTVRGKQPHPHIKEPRLNRGPSNSERELSMSVPRVQASRRRYVGRGEDVRATRIYKRILALTHFGSL